MIKILIADDHTVVREGLKQIISETSDLKVVGEARNGNEVLTQIWETEYDVVLLDISMPGQNGLDILKQLKNTKPEISVLILSMHPEEQYAIRALKLGASGYLTKDSASEELISAIRKVSLGGKYVSASLAEKIAVHLEIEREKQLHEKLSNREYQVMCMIAAGKTVNQISDELALSVKTISTYRSRILEKMNMKNNAELTYYAVKNGLIE